jgi:superoxide reductase
MTSLGETIRTADCKKEKHVPVIECPSQVTSGEAFEVKVGLGKEIAHPNTTEHHITWIALFFLPESGGAPYQLGHFAFSAHGESPKGPNEGPVHTDHAVIATLRVTEAGTLQALAMCNIHGLWESSKTIAIV